MCFAVQLPPAMTTDRAYRLAPGQSYALDELRRHAGTQFDSEIVEALVRCLDNTGRGQPAEELTPRAA